MPGVLPVRVNVPRGAREGDVTRLRRPHPQRRPPADRVLVPDRAAEAPVRSAHVPLENRELRRQHVPRRRPRHVVPLPRRPAGTRAVSGPAHGSRSRVSRAAFAAGSQTSAWRSRRAIEASRSSRAWSGRATRTGSPATRPCRTTRIPTARATAATASSPASLSPAPGPTTSSSTRRQAAGRADSDSASGSATRLRRPRGSSECAVAFSSWQ